MIATHLNKTQIKSYGIEASQNQIQRARNIDNLRISTLHEYKRTMPESRRKIEESRHQEIIKSCLQNSQISSYSLRKTKGILEFEIENYDPQAIYTLNTTKENIFT